MSTPRKSVKHFKHLNEDFNAKFMGSVEICAKFMLKWCEFLFFICRIHKKCPIHHNVQTPQKMATYTVLSTLCKKYQYSKKMSTLIVVITSCKNYLLKYKGLEITHFQDLDIENASASGAPCEIYKLLYVVIFSRFCRNLLFTIYVY